MEQVTPDRTMSGRASLVRGRAGVAVLSALALVVGVGGVGSSSVAAASSTRDTFEVRPVLAVGAPADACGAQEADGCIVARSRDGSTSYQLGPVIIDGSDVETVRARNDRANGWLIVMDLTKRGGRAFNAAAGTQFGKVAPQDRVALVVDGVVESAPAFQSPTFEGDISISGDFTKAEAKAAARAIRSSG